MPKFSEGKNEGLNESKAKAETHQSIAAFAHEFAGSPLDLDTALEEAGLATLAASNSTEE